MIGGLLLSRMLLLLCIGILWRDGFEGEGMLFGMGILGGLIVGVSEEERTCLTVSSSSISSNGWDWGGVLLGLGKDDDEEWGWKFLGGGDFLLLLLLVLLEQQPMTCVIVYNI